MTFAYAGLIPVFLTALLTKRGSTAGVIATLVTGFVLVLLMQPIVWDRFYDIEQMRAEFNAARAIDLSTTRPFPLGLMDLAFVWKLTIASAVAMGVGLIVGGRSRQIELQS